MSNSQLYDYETILENTGGDSDVVRQVVAMHLEISTVDLESLKRAIETLDFEQARKMAHRSKSGYMILGADSLYQLASKLETLAKNESEEIQQLFPEFEALNRVLNDQLRSLN